MNEIEDGLDFTKVYGGYEVTASKPFMGNKIVIPKKYKN